MHKEEGECELKEEEAYIRAVDVDYSFHLAKRMEQYKCNEALGYRTAGSRAEWETGEMIRREMEAIGLERVRKDEISLDSWEFKQAILRFYDASGQLKECQLGAYQTDFHTDGFEEFTIVCGGKGTAADYEGADVSGKLVLAEINQREEWWINFPVYEAHIRGAAALIAVQGGGYGEVDDTALNAQDIGGPADAPAFSMSRADARALKESMAGTDEKKVWFCADSTVKTGAVSYNIVGEIPGRDRESMILLSAHYDSYFSGFQDDNAAVALMLGIGRALIQSGYRPEKTIVFCAMAAEEWGMADSKYDWSTGAWQQVSVVHPEWRGKVAADFNFELPAHAHGKKDAIRTVYEYADFLESLLRGTGVGKDVYPEGVAVLCPVETMSDDFSMAISGIPSMVNDFTSGQFMETHYHTQFDNDDYYDEAVYRFHHELYGCLVMAFDRTAVAPLNFERLFLALKDSLDLDYSEKTGAGGERLKELTEEAARLGKAVYEQVRRINEKCRNQEQPWKYREQYRELEAVLMQLFKMEQDSFVRLDWHDEVCFPQEAVRRNLKLVRTAVECLENGHGRCALEAIYGIDNNRYAFQFDEEVFRHFTDYVMNQEAGRLQWGAGRIVHHENLFHLVQLLKGKLEEEDEDFTEELLILKRVEENQLACYLDDIEYMNHAIEKMIQKLKEITENESWKVTDCTE